MILLGIGTAVFMLLGLGYVALVLAFHLTRNTEPKREH
jgi:hypothetical protein